MHITISMRWFEYSKVMERRKNVFFVNLCDNFKVTMTLTLLSSIKSTSIPLSVWISIWSVGKESVAMSSKCCPPDAFQALARDEDYVLKGEDIVIDNLKIYVTGAATADRGSAGLIVAHDIFGPDSGRTKEICDYLSVKLKVLVILPDFFHGTPFFPEAYGQSLYSWRSMGESLFDLFCRCRALELLFSSNKRASWGVVGREFEDICIPLLRDRGCEKIGVMGFCWGGWFGCHAAANENICCVGAFHPSLEPCFLVGESRDALCAAVRCPVLMLTAGEDLSDVKAGGMLQERIAAHNPPLIADQCVFQEFKQMRHGR